MTDENILDLSTNAKKQDAAAAGLYFPGDKAVEYVQKQMPRNPAAVQDVLGLRQQLTEAQKFVIRKEGLVTVPYYATKDEKDNDIVTEGVGGVGKFRPKLGENFTQAFLRAYADKEATARRLFDNYDTFDPKLQTQIMSGVYRGDFKKEHKTVKAINKGDFRTASEQFLDRQDYKSWTVDDASRRKNQGLINRLEAIQKALETEFIRRANVPEFAEEPPSSSGQASQEEPTRDSSATAEATADQRRTEGAVNLLAGQPPEPEPEPEPNLQPDIPVNQLFQKGGTPMASEQENDEMIQIGLVQDPNDTDPVSGNEIPLGATAEGVRDDEVAAISPGEFVVPQYAVNYHGLDFYMDSLNTAKQGLGQMERMGMTGRPDEATLPDDMALPTMEEETTPILDRPIDTEMFMRGGLQTPVHSFANGGLVQYQTGGTTYTTPIAPLNVPTPTVATPTVQTPTVAPGAQVAAVPHQPGQMFYSQVPATPMPMQMPAVPQVQPGAPTIPYTEYQGITGGLFGGYKLQEYKHKDTGNSIFLTTVGGKLPPGVTVPPGYIPVEEYTPPADTPEIDPDAPPYPGWQSDAERAAEYEERLREQEEREKDDEEKKERRRIKRERVEVVEEALKKRPQAIAAGVDQYVPGLYNVPDHLAMNIVGPEGGPRRLTTDVDEINNYLQEQEKKGNAFMQQIVPAIAGIAAQLAIPVVPGVGLAARAFAQQILDDADEEQAKKDAEERDAEADALAASAAADADADAEYERLYGDAALAALPPEAMEDTTELTAQEARQQEQIKGLEDAYALGGLVTKKKNKRRNGKGLARR